MAKILQITPKPPYPNIDGGCVAMATMFEQLKEVSDVRLACISTYKHPFIQEEWSKENFDRCVIHHKLDTTPSLFSAIASFFTHWSYWILRFYNKSFEQKILDLVQQESITHVVLESLLLAPYIKKIKALGVKVVMRTHNVEHELWVEKSVQAKGIKKIALNVLQRKLFKNEVQALSLCDGIIAISPNEMNFAAKYAQDIPAIWIPLAIKSDEKSTTFPSNTFFHIGAMDWQPNIDGINWFFEEVWSNVHAKTNATMHIAGKSLSKNNYANIRGVLNHGEVNSANDFMRNSGVLVVPLFTGSGIRIKIIEAGRIGIPMIATHKAVEGLQLVPDVDYLAANTPQEFNDKMTEIAENIELQRKLGANLKKKILKQFEETQLNKKLEEFISNI